MINKDDGTIDLRIKDKTGERINEAEAVMEAAGSIMMDDDYSDDNERDDVLQDEQLVGKLQPVSMREAEDIEYEPTNKVKVKFDKFVNLIATHAYEDIIDKHVDQDIVISTDLLTDLANAHEEKEDKKTPLLFLLGIVLGIAVTWILLKV